VEGKVTLDKRKGRILQAVINDYVDTGDPIGSEWLVTRYDFGCKSATIRNEMAEMSDMGYLMQPYTSAGRIPSNRGYRYYVDWLMPAFSLGDVEQKILIIDDENNQDIDSILHLSCRMLADMTHYPSLATTPTVQSMLLQHFYITPASPRLLLMVFLFQTGHIEHRLIEVDALPADSLMQRLSNYLNEMLDGMDLNCIEKINMEGLPNDLLTAVPLIRILHSTLCDVGASLSQSKVFMEGTSHIFRQREFQDVIRMEQFLNLLEQRSILWKVFRSTPFNQDVTIFIGDESRIEDISDCSVVASKYQIRQRDAGYIGIVGPTRMHYEHTAAAVSLMARNLSDVLSRMHLG
jgi:heat-inducible transcriptional repressor